MTTPQEIRTQLALERKNRADKTVVANLTDVEITKEAEAEIRKSAWFIHQETENQSDKIRSNEQVMIEWENQALYYLTQKIILECKGKAVAAKRLEDLYLFAKEQAEKHFEIQIDLVFQLEQLKKQNETVMNHAKNTLS